MGIQQTRGNLGEFIAAGWLVKKGFSILHRNWRSASKEIDVIAAKADALHIIEIKTRFGLQWGWPEEAVTAKKKRNMEVAAMHYLQQFPFRGQVVFDVLSLTSCDHVLQFDFFEDI